MCHAQACATWDEVELLRLKKSWYVTLVFFKAPLEHELTGFCWTGFASYCRGRREGEFSITWKRLGSVVIVAIAGSVHVCCLRGCC